MDFSTSGPNHSNLYQSSNYLRSTKTMKKSSSWSGARIYKESGYLTKTWKTLTEIWQLIMKLGYSFSRQFLFWVAAPATSQPKIPPHPKSRTTCIFYGGNSQAQLYSIHIVPHTKACNFSFDFYSIIYWISQKWIFCVKNCFNC